MIAADLSTFKRRDAYIRAIMAQASLSPIARLLLVTLAMHRNCKTGQCNPSYETLGLEIGVSERTAMRLVAKLEACGALAVERRSGRHHTNGFILMAPLKGDNGVSPFPEQKPEQKGDNQRQERVTISATKGDSPVSPEQRREQRIREQRRESRAQARASTRSRKTLLPENWRPSLDDYGHAQQRGYDAPRIADMVERFIDYHLMHGTESADWSAAWHRWVCNEERFDAMRPKRGVRAELHTSGGEIWG
jgi:hypothetical protein